MRAPYQRRLHNDEPADGMSGMSRRMGDSRSDTQGPILPLEQSTTIPSSVARYCAVGLVNTFVGLGAIYIFLYAFRLGDISANFFGYAIGVLVSFALNKYWTFANRRAALPQLARFLLVVGCSYLANLSTVITLRHVFDLNPYVAQAAGIMPYTIAGYLGSRYFAFR